MPISRRVRVTRTAISPRLATRTLRKVRGMRVADIYRTKGPAASRLCRAASALETRASPCRKGKLMFNLTDVVRANRACLDGDCGGALGVRSGPGRRAVEGRAPPRDLPRERRTLLPGRLRPRVRLPLPLEAAAPAVVPPA